MAHRVAQVLRGEDITPTIVRELQFSRIINHVVYDGTRVAFLSQPRDSAIGASVREDSVRVVAEEDWQGIAEDKVLAYWAERYQSTGKTREALLGFDKFYVLRVLRHNQRKREILVQWVGYPREEAEWLPVRRVLEVASGLVKDYLDAHGLTQDLKRRKSTTSKTPQAKRPAAPKKPPSSSRSAAPKRPAAPKKAAPSPPTPATTTPTTSHAAGTQEVPTAQAHGQPASASASAPAPVPAPAPAARDLKTQNRNKRSGDAQEPRQRTSKRQLLDTEQQTMLANAVRDAAKASESALQLASALDIRLEKMERELQLVKQDLARQDRRIERQLEEQEQRVTHRIDRLELNFAQMQASITGGHNLLRLSR